MCEGYQKIKKLRNEFRLGIENSQRVSKMLGGYGKYQEGMGNIMRVLEMYEGYRKIKKTKHWV